MAGRVYRVQFKCRKVSGSGQSIGSYVGAGSAYTTSATEVPLTYEFTAAGTSTVITLEISGTPDVNTTAEFDDVSVRMRIG